MEDKQVQEKWDRIYTVEDISKAKPCALLAENIHLLPHQGTALDLACGLAGNALALIKHGLSAQAWDISPVVVAKLNHYASEHQLPLTAHSCDLTDAQLPESTFDVIVISHYLQRPLAPAIVNALKPNGLLFYQTFVRDTTPGYSGPSNPDFLLEQGELLRLFAALRPVFYREEGTLGNHQLGQRNIAQLVAQKN
ncbi:MAG: class I SAM-dependent methyltransferase [Gammaproteobacteria bacterium]|nr:class I SAM-dependent methyltransferase [Gammaproteobacteria bacterium]